MRMLSCLVAVLFTLHAIGQTRVTPLDLPDSVRAFQFYAELKMESEPLKEGNAGIQTDIIKIGLEKDGKEKSFEFEFPENARVIVKGMNTEQEKDEIEWRYDWTVGETYRLLIAIAPDSAGNFSLFSGYVGLPKENKWKLLGTCRVDGRWSTLQQPASFQTTGRKETFSVSGSYWIQRTTGSWRSMGADRQAPQVNVTSHLDSAAREKEEIAIIEDAIKQGKTDARLNTGGVYYSILKEGKGRQVTVDDTVVVHYKGYLFSNGEIFDQTRESTAKFPLKRLIRGWQIGVPQAKVGSMIKLVIPSHLAYSIRTRSPKIPPNSILVFEIEIVDAIK